MPDALRHLTPAEIRQRDERHRAVQLDLQRAMCWSVRLATRDGDGEFAQAVRELEATEGFGRSVSFQEPSHATA